MHALYMYARAYLARDSKVLTMADISVKKKRSFDAAFKLKVVEYAEMNTNRGAATKYSVDEKQVRQWRMKKDELKELPTPNFFFCLFHYATLISLYNNSRAD